MEGQHKGVDKAMPRVEGTEHESIKHLRIIIFMIIEFFFRIPKVNLLVMLKSSQVFPIGIVQIFYFLHNSFYNVSMVCYMLKFLLHIIYGL